jgi:AcrR family transcriptional regulator
MPRRPDPNLEARILNSAQKLWKKGGEKALTMRAVAKAAGTNTPTVYRRLRSRQGVLQALLRRIQQDVAEAVAPCSTPQEACERYLDFALDHPHEYELFFEHAYQLPRPHLTDRKVPLREERRTMALMEEKLAEHLGGSAADHTHLSLALWALCHGTAMILISKSIPPEHAPQLRAAFSDAMTRMIRSVSEDKSRVINPTPS